MSRPTQSNEDIPKFGDYVDIEMKRYGVPNEYFTHKVINSLKSNTWRDTPLGHSPNENVMHPGRMETVLSVVQEGIDETRVFRVLASECKRRSRNV